MNNMMQSERVYTGFSQVVGTPIGDVRVTYAKGVAEVSFHQRRGRARSDFSVIDGEPTMTISINAEGDGGDSE